MVVMHNSAAFVALGFDFGLKKIGIAVGQSITKTAAPLDIIPANNGLPNKTQLEKIIKNWKPKILVVGMPYQEDGSSQEMSVLAEKFAYYLTENFQAQYNLTIVTIDERYSSIEAKRKFIELRKQNLVKKGAQLDDIAACIILERWLQS